MLAAIRKDGERAVRDYAAKLDKWTGDTLFAPADFEKCTVGISAATKRDIEFATEQVRRIAIAQREYIRESANDVRPSLVAGQRQVPVNVAGCCIPTGRCAHIASACHGHRHR
jgi:sulfopropanediol 3-dehydrogenase